MCCCNHEGRGSAECGIAVIIQVPTGPMVPAPPPEKAPGFLSCLEKGIMLR